MDHVHQSVDNQSEENAAESYRRFGSRDHQLWILQYSCPPRWWCGKIPPRWWCGEAARQDTLRSIGLNQTSSSSDPRLLLGFTRVSPSLSLSSLAYPGKPSHAK